MGLVDSVIKFEDGLMDADEIAEFFQGLIDSGVIWQLQGSYGRIARSLIDSGVCHAPLVRV